MAQHHFGVHPEESPPPTAPRRVRRWTVPAAVIAVTALTVAGGGIWYARRAKPVPAADTPVAVKTVAVVRTDLSATESLTGTLGYGRAQPIKGGKDGIVTWLPRSGASIGRGRQLYRADDRPVPLFYGAMPLYRDLADPGTVGRDVRIVARNLKALGYPIGRQPGAGESVTRPAPPTAEPKVGDKSGAKAAVTTRVTVRKGEGTLTPALITAIKRWQRDTDQPETGRIGVGDVVVLSGAVRVQTVTALKGDRADTPLLTVTATAKVVTAKAGVTEAATISPGDKVTVVLPGDKKAPGKVTAVGTEAKEDESDGGGGTPQRAVTVTLDNNADLNGINEATVQVDLAGETHEDVLAVPVGALVALSEGGYAVQLAGHRLIAVETGMFAKGMVEVTGDGLTEGATVVTTS